MLMFTLAELRKYTVYKDCKKHIDITVINYSTRGASTRVKQGLRFTSGSRGKVCCDNCFTTNFIDPRSDITQFTT